MRQIVCNVILRLFTLFKATSLTHNNVQNSCILFAAGMTHIINLYDNTSSTMESQLTYKNNSKYELNALSGFLGYF